MTSFKSILMTSFVAFSFLLMGCSSESNKETAPALFDTKEEATKAAKKFNCTGAHQMGDKWMPCKNHEVHEDRKQGSSHGHNHHH